MDFVIQLQNFVLAVYDVSAHYLGHTGILCGAYSTEGFCAQSSQLLISDESSYPIILTEDLTQFRF